MRRSLVRAISAVGLVACVPPPMTPPQPLTLQSARPPAEVVSIATRELVTAGYDVMVSDAGAGTVAVSRKRRIEQFGADIACRFPKGSMGSTSGEVTLRVNVTAKPAPGGSSVLLNANAVTSFANAIGLARGLPDTEDDCVSSGAAEKRVSIAITVSDTLR